MAGFSTADVTVHIQLRRLCLPPAVGESRSSNRTSHHQEESVKALCAKVLNKLRRRVPDGDDGMSTAEYAVGTIAAVAFAVVLYKIVNSSAVMTAMTNIIKSALSVKL
jgi:hypothetical protein